MYDDQDRPVSTPDTVGRVFVGSTMAFDGYTDGNDKRRIDGLLASGDVGHFDENGRLVTETLRDFTKKALKKRFTSLDDFLKR